MGKRRLLDTSVLMTHWNACRGESLSRKTIQDARQWAADLSNLHQTNTIATPVVVEFLAGVRSSSELTLAQAYLDGFHVIDGGRIPPEDWALAKQLAQRVPRDGKPRHLGDCLIAAIAQRFAWDVRSSDTRFPKGK